MIVFVNTVEVREEIDNALLNGNGEHEFMAQELVLMGLTC